jgi:hypothetical protein
LSTNVGCDDRRRSGARQSAAPAQIRETPAQKTNGYIWCTLPEDLLKDVRNQAEAGRFDELEARATNVRFASSGPTRAVASQAAQSEHYAGLRRMADNEHYL